MENNRAFLRKKKVPMENKIVIPGNKKALMENKRAILGIKGHFWKVEGDTGLKTRPPLWGGNFWMFHAKTKFQKFFRGHFLPMGSGVSRKEN